MYRSHGGENSKGRPAWYSKLAGLRSFCRAVQVLSEQRPDAGPDVVFLNDGPVPPQRLDVMERWGEPLTIRGGSNRRSYLQGLALARRRGWAADDLVLLAEDDYMWRPEALVALVDAARDTRHADVDYFAPYGQQVPDDGTPTRWAPVGSTTSTFAVRVAALRQDERLMLLCALSGGDFDHSTCLTLQGKPRFGVHDIVRHHPPAPGTPAWRSAARGAYLTVMRTAVDLRSLRRPSRRRRMLGAEPALATHMEEGWIAPGPWEDIAAAHTGPDA